MISNTTLPQPSALLPHGEPILQIDRILEYIPGKGLTAQKEITEENPFLKGHFPGYPLMPGVILIEMMFQSCGLYGRMEAATGAVEEGAKKIGKAIKINNAVFKSEVRPGDLLEISVQFKQKIFAFSVFDCSITSDKKVVAEAEVTVYI